MNYSILVLVSTLLTTSIFACGSKSTTGSQAEAVQFDTDTSKPKPTCLLAKHAVTDLDKKLTEYEKGVLYAYYCK